MTYVSRIRAVFARKPSKRWSVRKPWLLVPAATLVSLILGVGLCALGPAVIPGEVGVIIVIGVLIFPVVSGAVLSHCLASPRPWRAVGRYLAAGLTVALAAWLANTGGPWA